MVSQLMAVRLACCNEGRVVKNLLPCAEMHGSCFYFVVVVHTFFLAHIPLAFMLKKRRHGAGCVSLHILQAECVFHLSIRGNSCRDSTVICDYGNNIQSSHTPQSLHRLFPSFKPGIESPGRNLKPSAARLHVSVHFTLMCA